MKKTSSAAFSLSSIKGKKERKRAITEFKKIQRPKQHLTQILPLLDKAMISYNI